ncbi:MAG: hypothetical protein V2I33_07470 [Kangiellaceae bacterium]|jgi:predicted metalloprotease with PDZ domain|nr:hypothetical protein [Kangiellaceae bacterium]
MIKIKLLVRIAIGFIALVASGYSFAQNNNLEIDIIKQSNHDIAISLRFIASNSDTSRLKFTNWAGLDNKSQHIEQMNIVAGNESLEFKEISDGEWRFTHTPQQAVEVSYVVKVNDRQAIGDNREVYRPIVNPKLFHAVGNNFLVLPQHLTDKVSLKLTWINFEGLATLSSLGSIDQTFQVETDLQAIYDSLYVAGPLTVIKKNVRGKVLYVSLHGSDWPFTAKELADLAEKITVAERDYFDDHDFPFYWISAIGTGKPLKQGYEFSGTRLHNNFALFLNPSTVFEYDLPTGSPIISLLAHEMMHVWFGGKLLPASAIAKNNIPQGTYAWLTEGFDNYFTNRVLFKSDILSKQQYINTINQLLKHYHNNSANNDDNTTLAKKFWTSLDHQKLPYQRGELIAFALDYALVEHSLKDLVLEWLKTPKWQQSFTFKDFESSFKGKITQRQLQHVMTVLNDGIDINWPLMLENSCLMIQPVKTPIWDSGFDHNKSFKTKTISGVRQTSAAYKAGLRDGQQLMSGSMVFDDIENMVSLKIDSREEAVKYLPVRYGEAIEQLTLKQQNCLD